MIFYANRLLDKHFPPGHFLPPLLNRNTVKVSYKCLPNMASIIAKNNSKVLNSTNNQNPQNEKCNCRNKAQCPLPGKCISSSSVIYQATVETATSKETYLGLTANTFKSRYGGHKSSFNQKKRKSETTLSKHIWDLKEANENYTISWKIVSKAQPYSTVTGVCQLCTREKYFIIFKPELGTLNRRNELLSSCRHKQGNLISKTQKKVKKKKRNPGR